MTTVFLDTSYIIALEIADDQYHSQALNYWQSILAEAPRLITTSFILDEVATFFNSRKHHLKAVEIGNNLLTSPSVNFIHVQKSLFEQGWNYFVKHADKAYSLTDCISFVTMEQLGLQAALSFDKHFDQAGFTKLP